LHGFFHTLKLLVVLSQLICITTTLCILHYPNPLYSRCSNKAKRQQFQCCLQVSGWLMWRTPYPVRPTVWWKLPASANPSPWQFSRDYGNEAPST